jgi:glycosyltransferase involved in cell wall biosynthesis
MSYALSIVIPVYNEEVNVEPLVTRLAEVLPSLPTPSEVLIVDDGSRDRTVAKLLALQTRHPWLRVVELRRNYGQHAATYAGFDEAQGAAVVTLDGDLQNDPHDIPLLVAKLQEGYDVVCGWRQDRQDPLLSRRLPSLIVNRLINTQAAMPVHDYGCFLRAYTQLAAKEVSQYSTSRGWFPVLFGKLGFRVAEVPVRHRERPGGEPSKHDFFRRFDQFISVFMGTRTKPFQFVEIIGAIAFGLGGLGLGATVGLLLLNRPLNVPQAALWCVALSLWGFLTTTVGLVGEYLVGVNYEIGRHPRYLVRKVHGGPDRASSSNTAPMRAP